MSEKELREQIADICYIGEADGWTRALRKADRILALPALSPSSGEATNTSPTVTPERQNETSPRVTMTDEEAREIIAKTYEATGHTGVAKAWRENVNIPSVQESIAIAAIREASSRALKRASSSEAASGDNNENSR